MITVRKNRQTGTIIEMGHQDHFGVDNGEYPWICYCQDHEEFMGFESKYQAGRHAASPIEWCDGCWDKNK